MACLRKAGIATTKREGKWMHYRLAIPKDEIAVSILKETLKRYSHDEPARGNT
jgi:ArsR family transcriptional regulator, arsenate/arsenite/antimonite-responsive transcriptional repressor